MRIQSIELPKVYNWQGPTLHVIRLGCNFELASGLAVRYQYTHCVDKKFRCCGLWKLLCRGRYFGETSRPDASQCQALKEAALVTVQSHIAVFNRQPAQLENARKHIEQTKVPSLTPGSPPAHVKSRNLAQKCCSIFVPPVSTPVVTGVYRLGHVKETFPRLSLK